MFTASATSNEELVGRLENNGLVESHSNLRDAFLKTDRALYNRTSEASSTQQLKVSENYEYGSYADAPQSIGHKATLSAPYVHAAALQALSPKLVEGAKVLDVGCGSGICCGIMRRMVGASGKVVGIDVVRSLVELSERNLQEDGLDVNKGHGSILLEVRWGASIGVASQPKCPEYQLTMNHRTVEGWLEGLSGTRVVRRDTRWRLFFVHPSRSC